MRIAAATALLDRGWGKPKQYNTAEVEITGPSEMMEEIYARGRAGGASEVFSLARVLPYGRYRGIEKIKGRKTSDTN